MRCVSFCVGVIAALALMAEAGAAAAQANMYAPAAAAKAKRMSAQQREERQFLKDAAAGSRFEAEASRMALNKSSNPAIRGFAATLINHHNNASIELLHMLHSRGMAAPMLANDQRKTLNRLARLNAAKFDREFMGEVGLRFQQEDVLVFEKAMLVTQEPRLRSWISRNLPTLRYHLATAERIAPADIKLAKPMPAAAAIPRSPLRQTSTQPAPADPYPSRASLATRSMGASAGTSAAAAAAAPSIFGSGQLGTGQFGDTQLGVTQLGVEQPAAKR